MFEDFDFSILHDPEFKEDSVREELILPIIKKLGYKISGDSRIIRSKNLIHPYVAIGSQQRKISIIPDYLFLSDNKPFWILDAKAPSEKITKSEHTQQAYSYAIHPEIRAKIFALCNGKEFALYSIDKFEPILFFELPNINQHWEKLCRILHPEIKGNPELVDFYPDFGVHLYKIGVPDDFQLILPSIHTKLIAKVSDELYTTSTVITQGKEFALSIDFTHALYLNLLKILPKNQRSELQSGLTRQPYTVQLENGNEFKFGAYLVLSKEIIHNAEESYLPFMVKEFLPYSEHA